MSDTTAISIRQINQFAEYDALMSSRPCIVKFTAKWCGPCRQIGPLCQSVASKYPHIEFLEVDIEQATAIVDYENVAAIPYFLFSLAGTAQTDLNIRGANEELLRTNVEIFAKRLKLRSDISIGQGEVPDIPIVRGEVPDICDSSSEYSSDGTSYDSGSDTADYGVDVEE